MFLVCLLSKWIPRDMLRVVWPDVERCLSLQSGSLYVLQKLVFSLFKVGSVLPFWLTRWGRMYATTLGRGRWQVWMVGTDRSRNVCIEFTAGIKFNVALNYCLIDDNAILLNGWRWKRWIYSQANFYWLIFWLLEIIMIYICNFLSQLMIFFFFFLVF